MSSAFDPYHKWLGIPPDQQPPTHYRLLGLESFESDADTIENAADQRMAHVRTFQSGQHARLSQQLLNQISVAKVCLLSPEKKAAYDAQLHELQNVSAAPVFVAPAGNPRQSRRSSRQLFTIIGSLAAATLVLAGGLLLFAFSGSPDPADSTANLTNADDGEDATAGGADSLHDPAPVEKQDDDSAEDGGDSAAASSTTLDGFEPAPPTEPDAKPSPPEASPNDATNDAESNTPPPLDPVPLPDPPASSPAPPAEPAPLPVAPSPPPAPAPRISAPTTVALQSALREIKQKYSDDYRAARQSAERALLAESLLSKSAAGEDDLARYALLEEARRLATEAGNLPLALQIVQSLAGKFDVDLADLQAQTLGETARGGRFAWATTHVCPQCPQDDRVGSR